jgi:uncharacterized protein
MGALTYIDTSLLVKRYVAELGSTELEARLLGEQPQLIISELVRTELISALRRKERKALMTRSTSNQVMALFEQDIASEILRLKMLNAAVLQRSARLVGELQAPLATLDALHLATALMHGAVEFFTTDDQLARAAKEAGLIVWPDFTT